MLKYAYRVAEVASNKPASSATAFNLAGALTGHRTVVSGIGGTHSGVFVAEKVDADGNPAGAWQVFVGTVTDATPDTLSQDFLLDSSSGSFIDWSATGEDSSPVIRLIHPSELGAAGPMADTARWYQPLYNTPNGGFSSGSWCSAGRVECAPIFLDRPKLLDEMRIHCTTGAAGATCRLGIYKDDGGEPGALLLNAGSVDCSSAAIKTLTGLATWLPPGRLWVFNQSSSSSVQFYGNAGSAVADNMMLNVVGADAATVNDTAQILYRDLAFGAAPPDPFGTASYRNTYNHVVQLKFSK